MERVLTTSGFAAATSAVLLGHGAIADTENYSEERKPRYRVTEEVRTFYRVNRYPASRKR
jgi:hypothetical protein